MLTFIVTFNYMLCGFVTGAFILQAITLFPFIDGTYWEDNFKYTAYWYCGPLIAEVATSFSALETGWYPVCTVLLALGWFICVPCWYYQVQLAKGDMYSGSENACQDNLIYLARGRACIWLARLIMLSLWISTNM